MAQMVKSLPAMQETWVQSLDQEDYLEKEMATPLYSWSCTTITTIGIHHPQKEALYPLTVTLCPPLASTVCFQSFQIFLFCIFHIHGLTQYAVFVDCPLSLSKMFSSVSML